jgi:DNA polymerase-3 subunit epsilon
MDDNSVSIRRWADRFPKRGFPLSPHPERFYTQITVMYAIVDIETTGGSAAYHKITEIAIVIHDGQRVIDSFETLINPERPIPSGITALTGISDNMVEDAPLFSEVAAQILPLLENKIFVAHNVNFDYAFLKAEFNAIGIQFQRKKLCTVRLSRKIFQGLSSYSLGNLCNSLGIEIMNRHRAGGDAAATAVLLDLLLKKDLDGFIEYSLNKRSKEAMLPPNLPREQYDCLPEEAGVYYFHDKNGKVVYVGKAGNLKDRVSTHFSGATNTKNRQLFLNTICGVTYELCGNELISLLLENEEIKKHWPRYNRSYKAVTLNCGIYHYEDQLGFQRLSIGKAGKRDKPVLTFKSMQEATTFLLSKIKAYNLCLRLCGIILPNECCTPDGAGWSCPVCNGNATAQTYNKKFQLAYTSFRETEKSFVIVGKGRVPGESTLVVVEQGRYLGFGYIQEEVPISTFRDFRDKVKYCYDNQDVQGIIYSHLKKCKPLPQKDFILYK